MKVLKLFLGALVVATCVDLWAADAAPSLPRLISSADAEAGRSGASDMADEIASDLTELPNSDDHLVGQIYLAVPEAIRDTPFTEYSANLQVTAYDGVVTLKGTVRSPHDKAAIEKRAQQIAGMHNVRNLLTLVRRSSSANTSPNWSYHIEIIQR